MDEPTNKSITRRDCVRNAFLGATGLALLGPAGLLAGCSPKNELVAFRGPIYTADGTVLAQSDGTPSANAKARRVYPLGSYACHVVGTCYPENTGIGAEYAMKSLLERNGSVTTTIRDDIQTAVETALDGHEGAAVVLDPSSGAILALASRPSFDPSVTLKETDASSTSLAQALLVPGSTEKIITLVASLEEGLVNATDTYDIPEKLSFPEGDIHNYDGLAHDGSTAIEAFAHSCNTFFADLSLKLGAERLTSWTEKMGYGRQACMDLPCEPSQMMGLDTASEYCLAWAGAGLTFKDANGDHGPVTSLLHQTAIAASPFNGGVVWTPFAIGAATLDDKVVMSGKPMAMAQNFASKDTLATVAEAMRAVVEQGTGKAAATERALMAGKTGTAEKSMGYYNGWFVGVARPVSNPDKTYAVGVMLSNASSNDAAEAARVIVEGFC